MLRILSNKNKLVIGFLTLIFPLCALATMDEYISVLINNSKNAGSKGFYLVKTRVWPVSGCLIDSGKEVLSPGERTVLKIKKSKECAEAGVGYSIYRVEDVNHKHLLGYLSHRFAERKFSVQISRFCVGNMCVFKDLNPEQTRS